MRLSEVANLIKLCTKWSNVHQNLSKFATVVYSISTGLLTLHQ